MKLYFIFGLPGAGKGVCAQTLKLQKDFMHFSLGDFLRERVRNKTLVDLQMQKEIMSGLSLIDCEFVFNLTKERILYALDNSRNMIIDGFPRTITQLNLIQDFLTANHVTPQWLYFKANYETAISRLLNRMHCTKCGYDYIFEQTLNDDLCNYCSSTLVKRATDNEEDIIKRCDFFYNTTYKVVEELKNRNILQTLKSDGNLHEFSAEFIKNF